MSKLRALSEHEASVLDYTRSRLRNRNLALAGFCGLFVTGVCKNPVVGNFKVLL